ncbi:MAG: hypothetical protein IPG42_21270 [Betaproteobacteria bacterium]|nr:hypothetical protein [Betaproteobacteria bacterium]
MLADHVAPMNMTCDVGQRLAGETKATVAIFKVDEVAGIFQEGNKVAVELHHDGFAVFALGDIRNNAMPEN